MISTVARPMASAQVVRSAAAGRRARAIAATTVKAHSQAVPATAAPTCRPPMWLALEIIQRSRSGQRSGPRPAAAKIARRT